MRATLPPAVSAASPLTPSSPPWHESLVFLDSFIPGCLEGTPGSNIPASSGAETQAKGRQALGPKATDPKTLWAFGKNFGIQSQFLTQICSDSLGRGLVPSLRPSFLIWEMGVITPDLQASESSQRPRVIKMHSQFTEEKDRIIQHIYTSENLKWCLACSKRSIMISYYFTNPCLWGTC